MKEKKTQARSGGMPGMRRGGNRIRVKLPKILLDVGEITGEDGGKRYVFLSRMAKDFRERYGAFEFGTRAEAEKRRAEITGAEIIVGER